MHTRSNNRSGKANVGKRIISTLLMLTMLFASMQLAAQAVYATPAPGSADQIVFAGDTQFYDSAGKLVPASSNPVLGTNAVVNVSKTLAPTNNENEFTVNLTVQTNMDLSSPVINNDAAVVLVLDVSGSMQNYMTSLITAAQTFAKNFADPTGVAARYLAVVSFSTNGTIVSGWTNVSVPANLSAVNTAIGKLTSNGSTNLESGLQLSRNLLRTDAVDALTGTNSTPIMNRNVIVFSDGAANTDVTTGITGKNVTAYAANTTVIGGTQGDDLNTTTANNCIKMANFVKTGGTFTGNTASGSGTATYTSYSADIFTLAFGTAAPTTWLASNIATNTSYAYAATDLQSLIDAFAAITNTINRWAQAWITTDPMGKNIDFTTTIAPNDQATGVLNFDTGTNTLTWDLKKWNPSITLVGTNLIFTYKYSYSIRLNTAGTGYVANTAIPTNGKTTLTYVILDQDGNIISNLLTATYDVPTVKGYAAGTTAFQKVGENVASDGTITYTPLPGCIFLAQNQTYPSYTYTATSMAGAPVAGIASLTLPSGFEYTLKETAMPTNYQGTYDMNDEVYTVMVSKGTVTVTDSAGKVLNLDGSGNNTLFQYINPPPGKTVTGYVEPLVTVNPVPGDPDWANFISRFTVEVELRSSVWTPATDAGLKTTAVWTGTPDSIGAFTFTHVQPGNYVLYIKRPGYLARCMNVTVAKSDPTTIKLQPPNEKTYMPADPSMPDGQRIFALVPGDCNDDGVIDGFDVMVSNGIINQDATNSFYTPDCDLNADGIIDGFDIMIILPYQNLSLDMYPGAETVAF